MAETFRFTDEHALLAQSATGLVGKQVGFERVRQWMISESGYDAALWREVGALGWLAVALPEAQGGAGLGATGLVSLAEAMGRSLLAGPWLATTLAEQLILSLGSIEQQAQLLPALASGERIATVAVSEPGGDGSWSRIAARAERDGGGYLLSGTKAYVLDGQNAELFLAVCDCDGKPAVFVVERGQLTKAALRAERLIDETRRSARLLLDGVRVEQGARLGTDATAPLARFEQIGALLVAAEMAGGNAGVMELTLEYLKTRVQFGKLIGGYQALKHPMAWIMVALEHTRSLVYRAATLLDAGNPEATIAIRMAKAQAGESFTYASDRAIQFHGAIGFTHECHAQLFFRRAQWDEYMFGDAALHRRRLGETLFDRVLG
jgi:alkylation response protein AidB-like acyl-CoA dehydrogenase